MKQWEKRLLFFTNVYSYILLDCPPNFVNNKIEYNLSDSDEFIFLISKIGVEFYDGIKLIENNLLPNWSIDRIGCVEKAIIISSFIEWKYLKTDKKIIIDQAIINTKKFGDKNSYKFVNYILDKILKLN